MNAKLLTKNTRQMSRVQLKQIKAPKGTKGWQPVEHYQLVIKIEEALNRANLTVSKEEIAVARDGQFLFYIADIERGYASELLNTKGYGAALAVMSSINKRIAIQIWVGARVEAGENLMFSGDVIVLRKKHSHRLKIDEELDLAIGGFKDGFKDLAEEIKRMKEVELEDLEAMGIILESFTKHKALPIRVIYKVYEEYFSPSHKDLKPRTLWSLQNAFTIAAKDLSPGRKFFSLRVLAKMFSGITREK